MQRFEWQDFLSVDDAVWDDGRRGLLEIINKLADPAASHDQEAVLKIIDQFTHAAGPLFAREDADMVAAGYPLAELHRRRRENLMGQLADWRQRIAGSWRIGMGMNLFLTFGLALFRHFCDDDLRFARFQRDQAARRQAASWRRAA